MVAIRTKLFATLLTKSTPRASCVRADAGKDQRGMMGIDGIFFARNKRFVNVMGAYGSLENIYAGLQLFMVAIRTNLFATLTKSTRGYVLIDAKKDQRGMMGID
jgi:hypothetical protein